MARQSSEFRGNILKESIDGETLIAVGHRYMIPDLRSSRGENMSSTWEIQERLARGTKYK